MIKKIDNTSKLFKKLRISPSFLNNNQKKLLKNEGFLIFRSNHFLKKNILKFRREIDKLISSSNLQQIAIKPSDKEMHRETVAKRFKDMIEKGLIEEVEKILDHNNYCYC